MIPDGELLDKISILDIKLRLIRDEQKLHNVQLEYDYLTNVAGGAAKVGGCGRGLVAAGAGPYYWEFKFRKVKNYQK